MNTNTATAEAANIVPLSIVKRTKPAKVQRFKITEFINPKTGSKSYRVTGIKRDGTRIRKNFTDVEAAQVEQIELETEYLKGHTQVEIRATRLTQEQAQLCEVVVTRMGDDWQRLMDAVDYWTQHGKPTSAPDCPRLDDAIKDYLAEVDASGLAYDTKRERRYRLNILAGYVGNPKLDAITVETIEGWLKSRNVAPQTKVNDRAKILAFFDWCMERPRKWIRHNPVKETERANMDKNAPIAICNMEQCTKLLKEAQRFKGGKMLPHVVVGLIGGLRPWEIQRMSWDKVNLADREITIDPWMTKTKRKRVITFAGGPKEQRKFNECLFAWLKACKGKPFFPPNAENDFSALKQLVGIPSGEVDILRHTAISHFFRLTGSYGLAAEKFGNSEAKIKNHYQGKVSSEDTKKFYNLLPGGKAK